MVPSADMCLAATCYLACKPIYSVLTCNLNITKKSTLIPDDLEYPRVRYTFRPSKPYCSAKLRGLIDKWVLQLHKISFWQRKIITVISEWRKFFSLTHCKLIFQHSRHGEHEFLLMEQFWISLHSENLDDDIPCFAFCFPGHTHMNFDWNATLQCRKLYHLSLLYTKIVWGSHY